ncbi:two-component regulator propeller domain-containing protein [Acidobacteriota bacterium]
MWLCLDNGISKIEYVSPFSIYDENFSNLPGNVLSVVKHQDGLYAGTTRGLYYFAANEKFQPVPGIRAPCRDLFSSGPYILAATDKGVFQIENKKKHTILKNWSYVLYPSRKDKNRLWVGSSQGLISLYLSRKNQNRRSNWEEEHRFENITGEIVSIVEDKKGDLWLGTLTKGVLRVEFSKNKAAANPIVTAAHITRYNPSQGMLGGEVHVFWAAGHVMFATGKGIFRFAEKKKVFLPDHTFGIELAGGKNGRGVFRIVEDRKKNTWIHSMGRNIQAIPQSDGTFLLYKKPFRRIPLAQVNAIYPDGESVWFAGADGLIHYNTNIQKNYDLAFPTLIRRVVINGKPVFGGYKTAKTNKTGENRKNSFPMIDYKDKNLRFEFSAPFFEAEGETEYGFFLEGYDDHWSAWTKETKKDYTNLDAGIYTFRVLAKNVY